MKKVQLILILATVFLWACNNSETGDSNSDTTQLIEEPAKPEKDKTEVDEPVDSNTEMNEKL